MDVDYDVVIVGARVAGSILGALLGGRGLRVLVLDRSSFPSDTLSTHFFRWPTFSALDRIGVLNAVYASAPRLSTNYNFVDGHVFTEDVKSPEGPSHHMCVRRLILDDLLVQRARTEHTVTMRERAAVTDLLIEGGTVIGVQWTEEGKQCQPSRARSSEQDGIHSVVSRHVNVEVEQADRSGVQCSMRTFEILRLNRPRLPNSTTWETTWPMSFPPIAESLSSLLQFRLMSSRRSRVILKDISCHSLAPCRKSSLDWKKLPEKDQSGERLRYRDINGSHSGRDGRWWGTQRR